MNLNSTTVQIECSFPVLFCPLSCVPLPVSVPSFGTRVRVESLSTTRLPISLVRYLHLSYLSILSGTTSQSCSLYPCYSSTLDSEYICLVRKKRPRELSWPRLAILMALYIGSVGLPNNLDRRKRKCWDPIPRFLLEQVFKLESSTDTDQDI